MIQTSKLLKVLLSSSHPSSLSQQPFFFCIPKSQYKPFTACLTIEPLGRTIIQQHNDVKLLHQKMLALRRLLPDNTPDNCCHVLNKRSVKGGGACVCVCVCNTYTSNINKSMTSCNQVDLAALSESKL